MIQLIDLNTKQMYFSNNIKTVIWSIKSMGLTRFIVYDSFSEVLLYND